MIELNGNRLLLVSMTIRADGPRLDGALLSDIEMLGDQRERCTGALVLGEQLNFKQKQKKLRQIS